MPVCSTSDTLKLVPIDGPAVILLHGWPYDIHSFGEVTPRLASAGFRVIVPYARGYGSTSFLSSGTPRTGQPSALAVDTIALMDALNIKQATIAGFDWGARTADIVAALWPDRVKGIVSVSGYLIGSQEAGKMPLASEGRASVVVSILFCDGAWSRGVLQISARVRRADLEARVTEMGIRRRDVRSQCGGLRQSGSRRYRDPQLSMAARTGARRSRAWTSWKRSWPRRRRSACRPSPSKATRTARHIRSRPLTPRNSPANTCIAS